MARHELSEPMVPPPYPSYRQVAPGQFGPERPPRKSRRLLFVIAPLIGLIVLGMILGDGGFQRGFREGYQSAGASATPTVATTTPAASTQLQPVPPLPPAIPESVTIPPLMGENAQIAYDRLTDLGFKRISLKSLTKGDTVPLYLPGWTVVSINPNPGTKVLLTDSIVVSVRKGV